MEHCVLDTFTLLMFDLFRVMQLCKTWLTLLDRLICKNLLKYTDTLISYILFLRYYNLVDE